MLPSSLDHRVDDVENAYELRYVKFDNLQTDHDDKKSVSEKARDSGIISEHVIKVEKHVPMVWVTDTYLAGIL
jgi:hypothetical protein